MTIPASDHQPSTQPATNTTTDDSESVRAFCRRVLASCDAETLAFRGWDVESLRAVAA